MGGDVVPAGLVSVLEQGSGRWLAVVAVSSSPPVELIWHFTSTSGGKSRFHRMGGEMAHTFPVSTVDQGFGRWLALPQSGLRHQWIRVGASSPPVAARDVLAAIGGDSKPAVRTIGGRLDHRRRIWPAASRDNVRRGGLSSHEDK